MGKAEVFQLLRAASGPTPVTLPLPREEEVAAAERALGVSFPPSYRAFLLEVSNVSELRDVGLPTLLLPFVQDDGDAFCFDLDSAGPEFEVVRWAHDDQAVARRWTDFLTWVEDQWLPTANEDEG